MAYAQDTSVSVEKTRAEIESLLSRSGATRFAYMTEEQRALIGFTLNNRSIKFVLPLPDRKEKRFWQTPARRRQRTEAEAYKDWEQACRSRWRALYLCIKAKLEACAIGITTFDEEFLAHFVLSNGRTVGESIIPQLNSARATGLKLLPEATVTVES